LEQEATKLSARRRCNLLSINRSGLYYEPVSDKDSELSSLILEIWLLQNTKGYRAITEDLKAYHGLVVNRKRVRRIMHRLKIHGLLPKRNLSKNGKIKYKYPYGLKNMNIYRSNIAWCSDITYLKLPSGYMYLVAIVDIYSRKILDYEISNTLDADFCITCLERCIAKYGAPALMNTDQGIQYTSLAWLELLKKHNIAISMDGKGRWADNIWVERVWRTIKYECIYLHGIASIAELKFRLRNYIEYYNTKRLHSSLGYKSPEQYYLASINEHKNAEFMLYCELNKNQEYQQVA
jgi:putative transposase